VNQSFDDEQVEKLLKGLPKAPPMSPLEVKRFEKQIDALVASEKEVSQRKSWVPNLSVAASVVAIIAGIAIYSGGSDSLPTSLPGVVASQSPQPGTEAPETEGTEVSPGSSKGNDDEDRTVYGESGTPTPGVNKKSVPVLNSNLDYSSSLAAAQKKVSAVAVKGNLDLISSARVACSIKLGIDEQLWAIDSGTYQGENIDAYYFGDSASNLSIKIVGFDCNLITEL
jgi:hypothetical protein